MENKAADFINSLKENLSGLSEEEKLNVILYYEEYLDDARDSGKDIDEVLKNLGDPSDIAAVILAEESFNQARNKPGIKNFNKVIKNIFLGVSGPFGYFIRTIYLIIVYSLIVIFTGASLASLLCAVTGFAGLMYETFKIPSSFPAERLGTAGMALFAFGVFAVLSYAFFIISRWLVSGATDTIRKMVRKNIHQKSYEAVVEKRKQGTGKLIPLILSVVIIVGLILSVSSGLPIKLFYIFNSMKPENIKLAVNEYNADGVKKMKITTEHSCIKIVSDNTNPGKIVITYEQPDWLVHQATGSSGEIVFKESANGRLPLFNLVSLHESRTDVTVYLPDNINIDLIKIESRGGFVYISDILQNIEVKTYTGSIDLDNSKIQESYNINAKTESGGIESDRIPAKDKGNSEISYRHQDAEKTIELYSVRGSIVIK